MVVDIDSGSIFYGTKNQKSTVLFSKMGVILHVQLKTAKI